MHKCINNSIGNVYHLEQFVSDFFPYSQKQLGFDRPATIRFESDQDNAGVMLGKTAYYDPESMEVVLYVDGRHPKDVMRSLSHELVHHAQNCRGDFTGQNNTGAGYAQEDPHLRKMEREAYTKGNLIFRDFEDLIKTGKINIEIDFSDSGEPKMSLKEWKNNEINTKLMKKWGFLKEDKSKELEHPPEGPGDPGYEEMIAREKGGEDLEERLDPSDPAYQRKKALLDKHAKETGRSRSLYNKEPADGQQAFSFAAAGEEGGKDATEELEEGHEHGPECGCPDMEEGMQYRNDDYKGVGSKEHDDMEGDQFGMGDPLKKDKLEEKTEGEETYDYGEAEGHDEKELHDLVKRHATRSHIDALKRDMDYDEDHEDRHERGTDFREGKISVKEAKQITRRIIERIRKEGK